MVVDAEAVERLLVKLRRFATDELDAEERKVLAALLAPAIATAYGDSEVAGFGVTDLEPLPELVVQALRRAGIRIVGIDEPGS
jgi:predicted nucleic acid-binding protein